MSSPSMYIPITKVAENASSYTQPLTATIGELLNGEKAFYNQSAYVKTTKRDFAQNVPLPTNYTWNTEHKIIRIAKQIFSFLIFPIAFYNFFHELAGKIAILPASNPTLMGYPENHADVSRSKIFLEGKWKYKRITVEVDGYKIDATIVGTASTLNNGRWMLASNGNGEFYEDKLSHTTDFKQILSKVRSNAIVFNYPGVGASSGPPNRQMMAKAYRAMLALLEDQKNGIGAKEIIGYGHSIGAAVQGDALINHALKADIKYVFVKCRTFSDMSSVATILTNKVLGFIVKLLGWNLSSVTSSRQLQAPEIIMQTANVSQYEEIKNSSKITHDGVIPAKASLAKVLLDDDKCPKANKVFIAMPEKHNEELYDPAFLAQHIEKLLSLP